METKLYPTAAEKLQLAALAATRPRRRFARSGDVHYVADVSSQVDFIHGTPVDAVPRNHLAWKVKESLGLFDFGPIKAKSSPLGRHGLNPEHLLAVWLLGSLQAVHRASQLEQRIKTDTAYRLLSGGHAISATSLRTFRRTNLLFFDQCVNRMIEIAQERGYLDLSETAVDSVRLEADAAEASIRTAVRSNKMVKELSAKDTSAMSPDQRERHQARLEKHTRAVEHCEEMDVTNYSVTDPLAALMKFPHGGAKPGHRLTTVVAGAVIRFCIAYFLSSAPTDHGLLSPTLQALRARLRRVGVPDTFIVKTAADAGFCDEDDVGVAHKNELGIDVVLAQQSFSGAGVGDKSLFGKEHFKIEGELCICPAGTKMRGPVRDGGKLVKWMGVGCKTCPLHAQCTTSAARKVKHNPVTAQARADLRQRMEDPVRKALYGKRGPIVESMYSVLEDAMEFRRVSSRHPATTQAEIVLKILAYNLSRLQVPTAVALRRAWG
jgi:hypothetical protein